MPLEDWAHTVSFLPHLLLPVLQASPLCRPLQKPLGNKEVSTRGNNNQSQHQVKDLRLCYNLDKRTPKLDEAGLGYA